MHSRWGRTSIAFKIVGKLKKWPVAACKAMRKEMITSIM